jgi:hypothetical protein
MMNDAPPEIKSFFQETSWKRHGISMLIRLVGARDIRLDVPARRGHVLRCGTGLGGA